MPAFNGLFREGTDEKILRIAFMECAQKIKPPLPEQVHAKT